MWNLFLLKENFFIKLDFGLSKRSNRIFCKSINLKNPVLKFKLIMGCRKGLHIVDWRYINYFKNVRPTKPLGDVNILCPWNRGRGGSLEKFDRNLRIEVTSKRSSTRGKIRAIVWQGGRGQKSLKKV